MSDPGIRRGDVWQVSLDPAQGAEVRKTRPCLVLTHDTLNRLRRTVVVVPLSRSAKAYPPVTVPVSCQGKPVVAIVDQVRAVAKHRLRSRIEAMSADSLRSLSDALATLLELKA
jgi:mRNA interferase MazF